VTQNRAELLRMVDAERDRQDAKWGGIPGFDRRDDHTYAAVLGEEFGECCKAWLERDVQQLREELIQTAAVALAWAEELTHGGMRARPESPCDHAPRRPAAEIVTRRPLLLDLFCGEGGAGVGYARAGFDVVGIDLNHDKADTQKRPRPKPLKRYPFQSIEMDALEAVEALLERGLNAPGGGFEGSGVWQLGDFAAIHASPPCQAFSSISRINTGTWRERQHPELIEPTRALLEQTGLPYVIENVERSPLLPSAVTICGSMFDPPLDVQRHRLFEANWPLEPPEWPCRHKLWAARYPAADYRGRRSGRLMKVVPVYGGTRYVGDHALRRKAMEIDWMTSHGLKEAIPPRYTEFIGQQLLAHIAPAVAA
jgi:DNA (cytosine-5)-methyltransferase 1